jgi:hypothetical protein
MDERAVREASPYDYPWMDHGCIYFIWAGDAKLVKIGHTTNHPDERLATLATMSPVELTPTVVRPGAKSDERAMHERFAHLRHHGEWFEARGDLARFMLDEGLGWPEPMPSPEEILAGKRCEPGELFTVCEAAAFLGTPIAEVRRMVWRGYFGPDVIRDDESPIRLEFTLLRGKRILWFGTAS